MSNIVQILINLIPKLYRSVNPDRIFVRGNEVDITAFEKVVIIAVKFLLKHNLPLILKTKCFVHQLIDYYHNLNT
jgi:hypothetical protein